MNTGTDAASKHQTSVERSGERELVVTRVFDAPARLVWRAWATPELFRQWWAPQSFGVSFVSAEADVRTGGSYRFVMRHPATGEPMAFFGRYLEATPPARLVWTNEEAGEAGAVTTVTFEDRGATTLVTLRDLYPSKEALDEAIASQATSGFGEQFDQLDAFLLTADAA
jgi:uncharacterized protein YndB with AHSA1/START domain